MKTTWNLTCETTNIYDQREVVSMEFESNTLDAVLDGMLRFLRANGYQIDKLVTEDRLL